LRRRLSLTLEMIRELDAVREQALEAQHDSASRTVKRFARSAESA